MQKTNYDSDFCGSLPIHLTNLIQSYGILLVVEQATGKIIQASENCDQVFNVSVQSLVNTEIQKYIGSEAYISLQEKFARPLKDKIPAVWQVNGVQVLSLIHRRENHLLIEINIEPITSEDQETFLEVYQELKYAMSAIESSPTVEEACKVAAAELKRISGFDKVMIYRFDKEWNGTVLAEVKEDTMESYFGFTFPASDIPQQARQLYLRNPYRFIPDCNYQPVKLYPVINPMTKAFIDLSDCNIRSVAAVHIEYLKNMNVTASMSTRILKNDKLWGLIACHHRTAKNVSYAMCSIFEILSGIISIKISSLENQELHENETRVTNLYTNLIEAVYKSNDLDKTLLSPQGVMNLFEGTGAVVTANGKVYGVGEIPATENMEDLILWLHTRQPRKNFSTDSLPALYENASDYQAIGSGLLVIPINYLEDQYILVFRPEKIRVINWGGNPDERIQFEKDSRNYHPRHSFKQWQEQVRGTSIPWSDEELKIAESLRSFIYEYETTLKG